MLIDAASNPTAATQEPRKIRPFSGLRLSGVSSFSALSRELNNQLVTGSTCSRREEPRNLPLSLDSVISRGIEFRSCCSTFNLFDLGRVTACRPWYSKSHSASRLSERAIVASLGEP